MQKKKNKGSIKRETLYIAIGLSLLVGFLSGVVFTIYKSPEGTSVASQPAAQSQNANAGHDLAAIEKQAAETPNDAGVWSHLGDAYFDADQPDKAIEAYKKSLSILPGNPDVLTDLGVMYRRNGQPDLALSTFNLAIQAAPNHEQPRFNKGVVQLFDKQDQAAAFKTWQDLLVINPMATAPNGQPLGDFMAQLQKPKP